MAKSNWLLTRGTSKIWEGTHDEVLSLVSEEDPFIVELRDGMKVGDSLVTHIVNEPIQRSEEEKSLRAFTSSIHKQIHDAADAAYRNQPNQSLRLLETVQERLNHFMETHADR